VSAVRLNPTDEMLAAAAGALGSQRVVQVLWRYPEPVPEAALRREWERLARGPLSRRAVSARVPGARRRWGSADNAEPLRIDTAPVAEGGEVAWLDEQARAPLDDRALWRLAAAPLGAGGIASLTVPHHRCDGAGLFAALAGAPPVDRPGPAALLLDDLAEAVAQVARAALGAVRVVADAAARDRVRHALRQRPATGGDTRPRYFGTAVFDLDAADWDRCARSRGGTANSLFVAIAANLVREHVHRGRSAGVEVGVPVNLRRSPADQRANALVVVPVRLPGGEARHDDLASTRHEVKSALAALDESSSVLVPEALWHLLPGGLAARLKAPGAQQTDVVASNFGVVPDGVLGFAGVRAAGVAVRTVNVPGLVPGRARLRASLCLVRTDRRVTVTATGMPDHFGDQASLHRAVAEEFDRWGLRAEPWFHRTSHLRGTT
jgi:hypothetical protein